MFGQWPRWFVAKCHSKPCNDPAQNHGVTGNGTVAGVAQRIPASSRVRLGVSSDDSRLLKEREFESTCCSDVPQAQLGRSA